MLIVFWEATFLLLSGETHVKYYRRRVSLYVKITRCISK